MTVAPLLHLGTTGSTPPLEYVKCFVQQVCHWWSCCVKHSSRLLTTRGEGGGGEEGKYMNEYVFILYVCYYYLYFCTEGNRFRVVYALKSTKCSSHRRTLGVRNNCPYNLYAYSASGNIYNYIIYTHRHNIHTYKNT